MANVLNSDPIYLDQGGNPLDLGRTLNIFKNIEWVAPEAVGDRAYLLDANGVVVCDFTCTNALENQRKDFGNLGQCYDGPLNLSQLDSGYLLLGRM
jgi:hypothetical protein